MLRRPMLEPIRAALTAVSCLAVSCILFVPERTMGDHCTFDGAETECGACFRAPATDVTDAGCADPDALRTVIPPMEECAAKSDAACGRVPASKVATCMQSKCGALCYERVGTSQTRCTDSFFSPGLACSCQTSDTPNDLKCDPGAYPRTRCCAPVGWPAPGLECRCDAIFCAPLQDGCNCILTDNLAATDAAECHAAYCCASTEHCQCRPRVCTGGEKTVTTCDKSTIVCPTG